MAHKLLSYSLIYDSHLLTFFNLCPLPPKRDERGIVFALSVCLSVGLCLSICLPIILLHYVNQFVLSFVYMTVYLFDCLDLFLPICLTKCYQL